MLFEFSLYKVFERRQKRLMVTSKSPCCVIILTMPVVEGGGVEACSQGFDSGIEHLLQSSDRLRRIFLLMGFS